MAPPKVPPLPKLEPPYALRPTFTRPLSLWNPLDYLRLLYWVFFHPQWMREYVRWCAPDYPERPRLGETWRTLKANGRIGALVLQSLILTIVMLLALSYPLSLAGASVNMTSVAILVVIGTAFGARGGLAFSVALSMAGVLGMVFGEMLDEVLDVAGPSNFALGATIGLFWNVGMGMLSGVAIGVMDGAARAWAILIALSAVTIGVIPYLSFGPFLADIEGIGEIIVVITLTATDWWLPVVVAISHLPLYPFELMSATAGGREDHILPCSWTAQCGFRFPACVRHLQRVYEPIRLLA